MLQTRGLSKTGRHATSVNVVYNRRPLQGAFLAKQQLLKTSSPDIANGGGMETEMDVQSGQVAREPPGQSARRAWSSCPSPATST